MGCPPNEGNLFPLWFANSGATMKLKSYLLAFLFSGWTYELLPFKSFLEVFAT